MEDTPSLVTLFIHLKETLCCPSRTSTLLGDCPSTHLAAVSTWSAEMRAPPHLHNPKGEMICTNQNKIVLCELPGGGISGPWCYQCHLPGILILLSILASYYFVLIWSWSRICYCCPVWNTAVALLSRFTSSTTTPSPFSFFCFTEYY